MTRGALVEPNPSLAWAGRDRSTSFFDYAAMHLAIVPALLFGAAWMMQHSPLDMTLAGLFFDPGTASFPWRASSWLDVVGHHAARGLPILVAAVSLTAWAMAHAIASLRPWRSVLLALGCAMLIGPLLINVMKSLTSEHCPSDILEFGGIVGYAADRAAPFWAATKQSAGHCLPSGHAGGGYALLSLYFAGWSAARPSWRWGGLAIGVVAGVAFSVVRMMQGAHFVSATLWSAAVDWTVCALLFAPLLCRPATSPR
jgi:membrane-associated PAP2 superfamily phosphatase